MAKRATIKDVAKRARVSVTTVSFVLNKQPGQVISEPVKKRVLKAASDLDYYPTAAAAGLARKHTHNVAIVFYRNEHLMTNQFYSFVVQGAVKEAIERDYNLLFSYISEEYRGPSQLPKVIRERNAEGALFIQEVQDQLVADVRRRSVAVVAVDNHPWLPGLDSLYVDNREGGRLATEHLLELGHERVVFLRAAARRPSIAERGEAFRKATRSAGLPFAARSHFVDAADLTYAAAYERALGLLGNKARPSAVFCANDEMAAGVLRAAYELELRIPDDLSVVGFDDVFMARYITPQLTTVSVDKELMGRRAMARLLQLLAYNRESRRNAKSPPRGKRAAASAPVGLAQSAPPPPATREIIPVELIVRQSTGLPPEPRRRRRAATRGTGSRHRIR